MSRIFRYGLVYISGIIMGMLSAAIPSVPFMILIALAVFILLWAGLKEK